MTQQLRKDFQERSNSITCGVSVVRENSQSLLSSRYYQVTVIQLRLLVNIWGIGICPQIFHLQKGKGCSPFTLQWYREK